ncbi:hypothetical protein G6M85_21090 [Agrobacterium tumefaciens]|uniref:DUF5983 family protein n=1 Tax=Agrobacterium tumefaciens TaxID=358 RepID=UPI001572B5CD|nr:hypothetical protein [Agrobacterium tumefaciens]NTE68103.1 hypothetical protein [Agrobacterium tumefaciens]
MAQLETLTVVTISTGHVSAETAAMLEAKPCANWPCAGGPYAGYGWFLYAHDENCGEGDQHIPDDLFAVMTWARNKGFSHVLLDRDADQVDGLTFHDW